MKPEHQTDSLSAYFRDSIFNLQSSVHHYHNGEKVYYRIAGLQLRLLLCDTTRRHNRLENISLLPKIIPDSKLPPLAGAGIFIFLPLPAGRGPGGWAI